MKITPKIEHRPEQPFMAIFKRVKMKEIPVELPPLIPEVINWVENHKLNQTGPVFFGYFNMEGEDLDIAVGVPVEETINGDSQVKPGKFPEGKYITATYWGPYENLNKAHMEIEKWNGENKAGTSGFRAEFYPTDPEEEPDPGKWQTDIIVQVL